MWDNANIWRTLNQLFSHEALSGACENSCQKLILSGVRNTNRILESLCDRGREIPIPIKQLRFRYIGSRANNLMNAVTKMLIRLAGTLTCIYIDMTLYQVDTELNELIHTLGSCMVHAHAITLRLLPGASDGMLLRMPTSLDRLSSVYRLVLDFQYLRTGFAYVPPYTQASPALGCETTASHIWQDL